MSIPITLARKAANAKLASLRIGRSNDSRSIQQGLVEGRELCGLILQGMSVEKGEYDLRGFHINSHLQAAMRLHPELREHLAQTPVMLDNLEFALRVFNGLHPVSEPKQEQLIGYFREVHYALLYYCHSLDFSKLY